MIFKTLNSFHRHLRYTCYGLVGLLFMATSCAKDTKVLEPGWIELQIAVPENKVVEETRHGVDEPGTTAESKINRLTIFVFNTNNTFETYKTLEIASDNTSTDPMWDPVRSAIRVLATPGQKRIYAVANWTIPATTEMPDISNITDTTALIGVVRVHNGIMPINSPVMSGRMTVTIAGGEQNLKMYLTRQIARVEIFPMISANANALGANVSIEGVKFMGLAQRAYLFGRGTTSPVATVWDNAAYAGATSGQVTATTTAAAVKYSTTYIPEYFGTSGTHTYMMIKAKYNGTDTYYSVPINALTGALPSLYAVERNHSYRYYLTIQGIGSATGLVSPFNSNDPGVYNISYQVEKR